MPELKCGPSATYRGWRSVDGPHVTRTDEDGTETPLALNPRSGLPGTEFEWGLDDSGADQLAFALLFDAFGEEEADAFYVDFKFDVVADLDDEWDFSARDVADWLDGYLDE